MDKVNEDDGDARPSLAIAYIRVSTPGQGDSGISLQAQCAGIKAFAERAGYDVVQVLTEIASARGANNLERRPTLIKALETARRLGAVLIVHDWTRLTRHEPDHATINAHLPAHRILSVEEQENLARAAEAGRLAYAQAKGDAISQATREGMARKKLLEGVEYGNPEILKLQPKGAAAAQAKSRLLREAMADALVKLGGLHHGLSNQQVAEKMNGLHLRTAQDKEFNARTVSAPLRDAMQILRDREQQRLGGGMQPSSQPVPGTNTEHPPGWGRF